MKTLLKKTILFAFILALGLAAMPRLSASAAGAYDPPAPPAAPISDERLELIWMRQLWTYERIGRGFEQEKAFVERVQALIDRAETNGKDASAVQAALDAFEAALKEAHPIYESTKGIVNSHQGFDSAGKVTDSQKARETVDTMHAKLKDIKTTMDRTARALREAIRAFREANAPAK